MKSTIKLLLFVILLAAMVAAGYWWGVRSLPRQAEATDTSHAFAPAGGKSDRKILYYRNAMGLPDISPVPKKDAMGMDYVPVYEGEEQDSGSQIKISTDRVQKLGVRTERAAMRALTRTVQAVGTLQIDERRINTVAPKFEGWIEQLYVNTTNQPVSRGQPLMDVYSPDLITAQQEYLIAVKGVEAVKDGGPEIQASMQQLKASALTRMRNWDISNQELQRLEQEGVMRRVITLRSPVSGVVVEKPALKGMRFMPGEPLYQISDLSSLWLLVDIFEQDLALVQPGQPAKISVDAFPGKAFNGKVSFLYPTVTAETRTGKVRIELPNPGGLLKPSMYASVELAGGAVRKVLTVPRSAIIDSGTRRIVLVQVGEGRFEPRDVKTGQYADDYVEIISGVKDGEDVVVSANFLIDAESNLKAAVGDFGGGGHAHGASVAPNAAATSVTHPAQGTIESVDTNAGTVRITHGEIPTLKWPAMTMEFPLANRALATGLKGGEAVSFELVERKPGEYVITRIEPKATGESTISHSGH